MLISGHRAASELPGRPALAAPPGSFSRLIRLDDPRIKHLCPKYQRCPAPLTSTNQSQIGHFGRSQARHPDTIP